MAIRSDVGGVFLPAYVFQNFSLSCFVIWVS